MGLHSIGYEKIKDLLWMGIGFPCPYKCRASNLDQHACARKWFKTTDSFYCVCITCRNLDVTHYFDETKINGVRRGGILVCNYCHRGNHPKPGG